MEQYYALVSDLLLNKLSQIKQFIKRHNPTIGLLTEVVLREFLKDHLPKSVSVEQGFIMAVTGELSKQCDILIYDSHNYAPFYRIDNVVIVPEKSVIAVIEVKTTINSAIFKEVVDYFENIRKITLAKTYLFVFNSPGLDQFGSLFRKYKHPRGRKEFDHDTFQYLPDEITGLKYSFHLKKSYVSVMRDAMGYDSWFLENSEGTEISALQLFFNSITGAIQEYPGSEAHRKLTYMHQPRPGYQVTSYRAIELFNA